MDISDLFVFVSPFQELWKWRNGPGRRGVHFGIVSGWGGHLRRSGVRGAYGAGASHPSWGGGGGGPGAGGGQIQIFFWTRSSPLSEREGLITGTGLKLGKNCDKTREKTPKGLMVPVSRGHTPPPLPNLSANFLWIFAIVVTVYPTSGGG